jgi:uncharacterized Tic20 family protein
MHNLFLLYGVFLSRIVLWRKKKSDRDINESFRLREVFNFLIKAECVYKMIFTILIA